MSESRTYYSLAELHQAAAARNKKIDKMRSSKEYQSMLQKNINWLKSLDASDSNPNNGRVDVSIFNSKVAIYGYNVAFKREELRPNPGVKAWAPADVDIEYQAVCMTDKYYSRKFGL